MHSINVSGGKARKINQQLLFEHEFLALLEALRRDLRRELQASAEDHERRLEHANNARRNRRILDALQPKHSRHTIPQERSTTASLEEEAEAKIVFNLNTNFSPE